AGFGELVERVRESSLGAQAHEDVPFERLVDELKVERDLSRTPLFQVMCVLQNAPEGDLELPGIELDGFELPVETAKFDLFLAMEEVEGGLEGELNYSADLFEVSTIERMVGHLETLLRGVAEAPERPLRELALLSEAELCQLRDWGR